MNYELTILPNDVVNFQDGRAALQLMNSVGRPVAFKVKVTDNSLFRVDPAVGIMQPGESAFICLSYTGAGPAYGQNVGISYIDASFQGDPRAAWAAATGQEPNKFVPINIM